SRAKIVEAVIEANNGRKDGLAERIARAVGGRLDGKRVAVLGGSFKAETDDLREAASLAVIPARQRAGATIAAYDPVAREAGGCVIRSPSRRRGRCCRMWKGAPTPMRRPGMPTPSWCSPNGTSSAASI